MNIADVTIAGAGIGLSVRFRAIAVGIADGAAAYGPERFNAGTVGRRRRRLDFDPRPKWGFFFNRNNTLQTDQTYLFGHLR